MDLKELKVELENDVKTIVSSEFDVQVSETKEVPTLETSGITYPNLDTKEMKAKQIKTCVLYIDMRKSTELNLKHKPRTLTKLYGAFMRAMVKAAQQYDGKVRNIIGDRVMVIFDEENCFTNAVRTSFLLNSVGKYIIDKYFPHNDISFGIGVDYGRMLVSKGGVRKNGSDNAPYKSLVWLGRPANVASKLTDLANKQVGIKVPGVKEYIKVSYKHPDTQDEQKFEITYEEFFTKECKRRADMRFLDSEYFGKWFRSEKPFAVSYFPYSKKIEENKLVKTPSILVTEEVYLAFKKANPEENTIKKNLWEKQENGLYPGYTVYGGNLIFSDIENK